MLSRAISLDPYNSSLFLRRATITRSPADLERAAQLNPSDPDPWLALALLAERRNDHPAALAYFDKAISSHAGYLPRWSLVNYHYRQRNWEPFWMWAKAAADLYEGDLTGLFRLALRANRKPEMVLESLVPRKLAAEKQFLELLFADKDYTTARAAAIRLLAYNRPDTREHILYLCDRLIEIGETHAAAEFWNRLIDRRWLPYQRLDKAVVTNSRFEHPLLGRGFDWQNVDIKGVTNQKAREGLRIALSGRQPGDGILLRQIVPLAGNETYRLQCRYNYTGKGSGIRLRVGSRLSDVLDATETTMTMIFRHAPGSENVLELLAGTEAGEVKPEGVLDLYEIHLEKWPRPVLY